MRTRLLCAATTFAVAILGATPAWASNWLHLQKDGDRDEYVDTSSFVRSGTNVKVWTKSIFGHPQRSLTSGRSYVVQLVHNVYACDRRESTPLGYRLFSTLDQTVLVEEADYGEMQPGWDEVIPGTMYDRIRTMACKAGTPAK